MTAIHLPVKVVPGSRHTQIVGKLGNRLKIKIQAVAEDGKANQELVNVLAQELGVSMRQIEIVFGNSSPEKLIQIQPRGAVEAQRIQQVINAWYTQTKGGL